MAIDPLKPYGLEEPERPFVRPWYTHWWGVFLIIIFTVIIAGGSLFGWRVWSYYNKLKTGELASAVFQFPDSFTAYTTDEGQQVVIPFFDVITQDDPQTGPIDAAITIVEFADFKCQFCAESALAVRGIAVKYPNDIRYIFRDFPVEELHAGATAIHIAGECAKDQGKFWAFHDKIFQNQDVVTTDNIKAYAAQVGVDIAEFDRCLASKKYDGEVARDIEDARSAGVYGTPTFFINGRKIEGSIPADLLDQLVQGVLAAQK
ncbi:MAG: thioredoxin domain-containing protein [Patescibacteria group bacterium]|nr:thioredoxin domain-containing protein [Patescibacteria group bacterium]